MAESTDISKKIAPDGFRDIAAILADQIAASHKAASRCFSVAADEEDFGPEQRDDALRVASRLMHACAASANAIRRIQGGEFRHTICVEHVDYTAERAARKRKEQQALEENPSPGELMARVLDAEIENDLRSIHQRLCEISAAKERR
ncbi:MAG TPA: hypothetical protein VLT91_14680 [Rhizomicrobium sp.]|nr:hypothetical protein [Rhizomicrobium sp.]